MHMICFNPIATREVYRSAVDHLAKIGKIDSDFEGGNVDVIEGGEDDKISLHCIDPAFWETIKKKELDNAVAIVHSKATTRTFANREQLVEAMNRGELWYLHWSHPSVSLYIRAGEIGLNGCRGFRNVGHYEYKYCDGKTVWHRAKKVRGRFVKAVS